MAAFKIGQRVRVKWVHDKKYARQVGLEGVITEVADHPPSPVYGLDSAPLEREFPYIIGFFADQLEPILYDGNQLVSWESMKDLWTPTGGVAA